MMEAGDSGRKSILGGHAVSPWASLAWSDGARGVPGLLYQAACWWPPSSLPSLGCVTVRVTLMTTPHCRTAVRRHWCSEVRGRPTEAGQWESSAGHRSLFQVPRGRMSAGFAEDRRTHHRGGRGLHPGPVLGFMWCQDRELQRRLWPLGHHVLLTMTVSRKTQPLGAGIFSEPSCCWGVRPVADCHPVASQDHSRAVPGAQTSGFGCPVWS